MYFQVLRAKYAKGSILGLLEQNWAWNECHRLGAMRMDEIEDLKMMIPTWTRFPSWSRKVLNWRWIPSWNRFPSWIRIPSWNRFPSWIGIPRRLRFPSQTRFPTWSRKVKPQWPQVAATKKFSKSKKEKESKMKKDWSRQVFPILMYKVSSCNEES